MTPLYDDSTDGYRIAAMILLHSSINGLLSRPGTIQPPRFSCDDGISQPARFQLPANTAAIRSEAASASALACVTGHLAEAMAAIGPNISAASTARARMIRQPMA